MVINGQTVPSYNLRFGMLTSQVITIRITIRITGEDNVLDQHRLAFGILDPATAAIRMYASILEVNISSLFHSFYFIDDKNENTNDLLNYFFGTLFFSHIKAYFQVSFVRSQKSAPILFQYRYSSMMTGYKNFKEMNRKQKFRRKYFK